MEGSKLDQLKIEREPEEEAGPARWPVLVIIMLVVAIAGYWLFLKPDTAVEVRTVVAREISKQVASTVLNASGYVTARRQATVSSKFTGKVMEVLIEEGMTVEKDQVLARLELEAALPRRESAVRGDRFSQAISTRGDPILVGETSSRKVLTSSSSRNSFRGTSSFSSFRTCSSTAR